MSLAHRWTPLSGLIALVLALGCPAPESPAAAYTRDRAALVRGRSLFIGTCGAYCHGLQPGLRDAPFLFDCEWKHGNRDEDVFRVIHDGVAETAMPGFADKLPDGDQDIWKLVAFLRTKSTCR